MACKIVPHPQNYTEKKGFLEIKPEYRGTDRDFDREIHAFSELCDKIHGRFFTPGNEGIEIVTAPTMKENAYRIEAAKSCVITVSSAEGLGYALSSLLSLIEKGENGLKIQKCVIEDAPESPWRCFMLDVARRWHPVPFIYRYIDLCYLLKINKLQLHFTDDESYTLPSYAYPNLATPNRSYSREELRAIDAYANAHGVTLVPEIDMPGHCGRFMTEYPEVFGSHGIMSADETTFKALETLYSELCDLFPNSPYIHMGGDEGVPHRWLDCEKSVAYMKKHNIEDPIDLYGHYVGRMTDYILSLGRTPIVWEGFFPQNNPCISRDVIVVGWESYYQPAPQLAEAGFTLINASWKPLYIVAPWTMWNPADILDWDIYMWTHWWEKSPAYNTELRVPETTPVLGGQICAWGDYLKNYECNNQAIEEEAKCVKPRLAALAEKTWTVKGHYTKRSFGFALKRLEEMLEKAGI